MTGAGSRTLIAQLLDSLPPEARTEVDRLAREITVRDSMVYLDGKDFTGLTPGLRTGNSGQAHASRHPPPTSGANG